MRVAPPQPVRIGDLPGLKEYWCNMIGLGDLSLQHADDTLQWRAVVGMSFSDTDNIIEARLLCAKGEDFLIGRFPDADSAFKAAREFSVRVEPHPEDKWRFYPAKKPLRVVRAKKTVDALSAAAPAKRASVALYA